MLQQNRFKHFKTTHTTEFYQFVSFFSSSCALKLSLHTSTAFRLLCYFFTVLFCQISPVKKAPSCQIAWCLISSLVYKLYQAN